jgi:hypothetical protein
MTRQKIRDFSKAEDDGFDARYNWSGRVRDILRPVRILPRRHAWHLDRV